MENNIKTAIVTTLIGAEDVLDDFLKYHFSIGFDYIFLFFDKHNDPAIDIAEKYDNVIIFERDYKLIQEWMKTEFGKKYYYNSDEIIIRQCLNVSVAIKKSIEMGIDRLLHIDIDEIFYSPNTSVKEHFYQLEKNNIDVACYKNYEAIPEKLEIKNYFREVSLFKKDQELFSSYKNGKSSGKVSPQLEVDGVHKMKSNGQEKEEFDFYGDYPVILHYHCCGFENFYKRFNRLTFSSEYWFSRFPLYIEAKETIHNKTKAQVQEFYEKNIMLKSIDLDKLIKDNKIVKTDDFTKIIKN